jgi:hypothetical protein
LSDILLDVQSPPATPSAGQIILYGCTRTKKIKSRDDAGVEAILGGIGSVSTANQAGFATDAYLTGSPIAIPNNLLRVGSVYRLVLDMVKTAAGTATPIFIVRVGTAGTTADAARLTFTFAAGTAAVDTGTFELWVHVRTAGASAIITGMCRCLHHLAATGLTTTGAAGNAIILATSAAFDLTVANSIIGVSFNGGASFSGTNTLQQSTLDDA